MSATRLQPASLNSAARLLAMATALASPAAFGQPQRWQHDFGVQTSSPTGATAFYGTNGAGVTAERGRMQAQVGTGQDNTTVGVGGCLRAYPAPVPYFPAVRAGGEVCAYVTPQGVQTTVAPGVMLPNGATANAYYANTYNPMAPSAAQQQAAQEAAQYAAAVEAQAAAVRREAYQAQQEQIREYELMMRQQAGQYAYNPPSEFIAPYTTAQQIAPAAAVAADQAVAPVQPASMQSQAGGDALTSVRNGMSQQFASENQAAGYDVNQSAPQPQTTYYNDSAPRDRASSGSATVESIPANQQQYGDDSSLSSAPAPTSPVTSRTEASNSQAYDYAAPAPRPEIPTTAPRQSGTNSATAALELPF